MGTESRSSQASAETVAPRSVRELFLAFSWLALQGFGGVLAVAQRELVEKKRWLTREEFTQEWAVAQIMPGPNVINMAIVLGGRHFGWRGALASVAIDRLDSDVRSLPLNYVTLDHYRSDMRDIKDMLGKIFDKLDNKVDK